LFLYKSYRIYLPIWAPIIIHILYLLEKRQTNEYVGLGNFIHQMRLAIDTDYYKKSDEYLQKLNAEKNKTV
jgi:hypothetical protein